MKVDRSRLKKSTSDVPIECHILIDKLISCRRSELLDELSQIDTWTFGKCELYHWIDVLDIFDKILEEASQTVPGNKWALTCDVTFTQEEKKLLLWTLHFTTLLIEHSFSRHLYNSMEHLNTLLASSDMQVVLGVLNLLYMFSKRSNFITRLNNEKRQMLLSRLHYLAESWGGKENGFGLADCCNNDKPIPNSATTLHFEFYCNNNDSNSRNGKQLVNYIHLENIDKMVQTPAEIMRGLIAVYNIPPEKEMLLFTHVRLAHSFSDYKSRLFCVQARLQSLSVLVYSNALQDNAHMLLYPGLLEELVELLELQLPYLVEIRSAALRTLTSIIHLDRNPHFPKKPGSRLSMIIDVTGASLYHGFLPTLVRTCISTLTQSQKSNSQQTFPLPLATALFSFLYHLASYEAGGEALVNCGMMESLLHVINWHGYELEHITFVTRAVRVIDLITNIDMQSFQSHGGLDNFINRLNVEVNLCRKEQPYEIKVKAMEMKEEGQSESDLEDSKEFEAEMSSLKSGRSCLPQRAALLKSMLNFLKKALQDPAFSDNIRHVMEGTLPASLKHIISNAEYYGPSLFLLATDVVTVYVFQEPTLLASLQDNGLTDVVLHALLIKDVPATREVLGSLPNVFSALCLNARGLASFVKCKPFERLFKVLLSPNYLPAMRRRRSSDPLGDTASNLGNAMDELMRHQPSLKVDATAAIIKLLNELCQLGTDSKYVCHRAHTKSDTVGATVTRPSGNPEAGSSDEDDDEEEEASTSSHTQRDENSQEMTSSQEPSEKTPIVLVDYILNVMKFVDAILSNNSTDDHCREFVKQGGLVPLLKILGLPNLPVDCPVTAAAQAVASVCKSILNLAHEPKVLKQGLTQLKDVLENLKPLCSNLDKPGASILLHELANAPNIDTAFTNASATPLLHAMNAAHGYVLMFVHVCRTGQNDIRNLSLQHWGSDDGLLVLNILAELYTSLVWESTLLLALCSDDIIPDNCNFGKEDMEKLKIYDRGDDSSQSSNGMTTAMEALSTNPTLCMEVDGEVPPTPGTSKKEEKSPPTSHQLKYIKPLLGSSSRLGRALAELFGLLVKLCVGSPMRQRRGQNIVATPSYPGPFAREVATALNNLLANGLNWEKLPPSPVPKFRLTFLICSVGFTSPMLFDEKRYPYHLMLQKFVSLGGQTTFFATFRWALSAGGKIPLDEGLEHPDLPDGTGEFLDAWLMLLEKMVNPKAILDSPHVISKTNARSNAFRTTIQQFDPLKYLIQIHKLAFDAVKLLWGKKPLYSYGSRMSESILSILRHILRGEKLIKDKLGKIDESMEYLVQSSGSEGENIVGTASGSSNVHILPHMPDVNYDHMCQLLDMGFRFEHCRDALLHTNSLEQATEYLLNNPQPSSRNGDFCMASSSPVGENKQPKPKPKEDDFTPLTEEAINEFTQDALKTCLSLLDILPDTVYRVCDLLVTITKRNGETFRDHTLDVLLSEIGSNMMTMLNGGKQTDQATYEDMLNGESAAKMAVRLHLFTLLFEGPVFQEMRIPCAEAVHRSGILPAFVKLLIDCESYISRVHKISPVTNTPKWLTPLLLLLDLVEKVSLCTQRKDQMHKVTNRIWKWFDQGTGKWTPYSSANNKLINNAYWNNEPSVRVTCGRRRYTITFNNMMQMNEESGNTRPVAMVLINNKEDSDREDMELDEQAEVTTEKEFRRNIAVEGLDEEARVVIVKTCVRLMSLPFIDRDTLHAILRICLRLTRDFRCARIFAAEGGVRLLLSVSQASAFTGFVVLATLLIRHVLEEPQTLCLAMEKVIRARTLSTIPPAYKEILYVIRQVSSAVCRNSDAFYEVARNILRIDTNYLHRRNDEEDGRLLVRCEPPSRSPALPIDEEVSISVVYELLNALIKPNAQLDNNTSMMIAERPPSQSSSITQNIIPNIQPPRCMYRRTSELLRASATDIIPQDSNDDSNSKNYKDGNNKSLSDEEAKKPLLLKPALLKLLAEAVRSYGAIAKIITEFTYKAGQSEMITEDCTALAFMLDKLLPVNENSDPDCSMMARMLLAAIASCNHSPDAQSILVTELKNALQRALSMPESTEKHSQIQMLTGLICTMIENCPPTQQQPYRNMKMHSSNNSNIVNNIVQMMLRKGIMSDLAKVPHYLDLSSPNMAVTVNAALKPLETLSRIVNQPFTNNVPPKYVKPKGHQNSVENPMIQSGTTSTEATNAQGEDVAEDLTENTEHDISTAVESLEPHSETQAQESDVAALEDIMEQILDRDGQRNTRNYNEMSSGQTHSTHSMEIEVDGGEIRNLVYETERDVTEELMSTDSGDSDSNPSDQEVEDEDNDDEVDDEDIEDCEENDENNYEEDEDQSGLEFYDNENPGVFRIASTSIDREEEVLMIQYSDPDLIPEPDSISRMVHWNPNGIQFGIFDEIQNPSNDVAAPSSHPLLMSRPNIDGNSMNVSRTQRNNRQRRYHYLQINPRNPNPVILQRLLGPGTQNLPGIAGPVITEPGLRVTNRVVVMDNGFGIFPNAEEQIDFVDQSGFLFGPSLTATLANIPSALHWWNEEAKLLDGESQADVCSVMTHKLIPILEQHRDIELQEKRRKRQEFDFKNNASKHETMDTDMKGENQNKPPYATDTDSDTAQLLAESIVASVLRPNLNVQDDNQDSNRSQSTEDAQDFSNNLVESIINRRLSMNRDNAESSSQPVSFISHNNRVTWEFTPDDSIHTMTTGESINANLTRNILTEDDSSDTGNISTIGNMGNDSSTFEENIISSSLQLGNSSQERDDTSQNLYRSEDSEIIEILNNTEHLSDPPMQLRITHVQTIEDDDDDESDVNDSQRSVEFIETNEESSNGTEFQIAEMTNESVPVMENSSQGLDPSINENANSQESLDSAEPRHPSDETNLLLPLTETLNSSEESTQENPDDQNTCHSSQDTIIRQPTTSEQLLSDVPEGVDPSFLEALPEDVRREVITEQRRLMRLQQRTSGNSSHDNAASGSSEVSPEFLAALPPALQEEVLAQQRLEQQRQAAATVNPDDPVDTAAFFQNLQPSLRQAILTDIEESQISVLPPELAAEAQNLRRDWEARNRQLMQERFLNQLQSNTALSSILRHSGRGRLGTRYAIHTVPQRCHWNSWSRSESSNNSNSPVVSGAFRMRGRQLLDHESLSCLLVLLFADEPKLNTLRLHRVIRNLCYHTRTREWIVKALLSIIDRSVNLKTDGEITNTRASKRTLRPGPLSVKLTTDPRTLNNNAAWLNIKMDAALGCRANVFIVHRHPSGKRNDRQNVSTVTVHPQAAPIVCRHALDLFISLAKNFPSYFLTLKRGKDDESNDLKNRNASPAKCRVDTSDFWEMLLKLDSLSATKKGKSVVKTHSSTSVNVDSEMGAYSLESSTFSQLLSMLSSNVINRSPQLTDKLLRLLSLITLGLPEMPVSLPSTKVTFKQKNTKIDSILAHEESLRLAINVITSRSCSEEGLEDAATLLYNVGNSSIEMHWMVLHLMLNGAVKLAEEISGQINNLLDELKQINNRDRSDMIMDVKEGPSTERPSKGLLCDRFTKGSVVITASSKVKQSCDLQLPSMAPLTTKTSSQTFFLRLLRLIAQIYDNIKKTHKVDFEIPEDTSHFAEVEDGDTPMETNEKSPMKNLSLPVGFDFDNDVDKELVNLSEMMSLGKLWNTLSLCLLELEHTPDHHAVLVLQPTVEAFFLVHSPSKSSNETNNESEEQHPEPPENDPFGPSPSLTQESSSNRTNNLPADQQKFLQFAEKHRTVLNQILRQTASHLADGPFSVLVDHTRILDFDVKRKYFRTELERLDNGVRREETAVHVRRSHIFEDSFRELYRRTPEEWKNRFYIVFEDEEGQDAGGLLREWYMIISRDIFNPMYALFIISPGDRVTYMINSSSHANPNHLCYYKFVGRVIAKAIYDNKLLECYFTRSFYKHILGIQVKYTDMESEDYSFYKGLVFLMENNVADLGYDLTFSCEVNEFGSTQNRDLIPNGQNILVTEENKMEYIRLLCQMKMTGAIKQQLKAFLEGFYDIIPKRLISIFNEQELELLISGLPNVDIEDLKSNTEYHKYQSNSLQIQWFWRALRSFDQAERAKFLQFVTGTSKVPLQGFVALEGMNGTQKFQIHRDDRSTDRLPSAHTCFNQLDLPVYETYDKLRSYLLKAIHECSEGFGFA